MEKKYILALLLGIIIFTSCRSFYRVDTDELQKISDKDVIQLRFGNGKKLNITNVQYAKITKSNELEIIKFTSTKYKTDSVRTLYPMDEIKEIRVKKFDIQKSFFSTMWISIGAVVLFFIIICRNGGCTAGG